MLPRRCKKCRCYVAPQLTKCPRCGTASPSLVVNKPTKEEQEAALATRDAKVPTIDGKKIHWMPSAFALRVHHQNLEESKRLLAKAETARERNAIRSEIRSTKAFLARKTVPSGKRGWTTERVATTHTSVVVFVSPKNHRYVIAERDAPADLIIIPAKKKNRRGGAFGRLQRFEKSPYAKAIKKERKDDAVQTKRRKSKTAHRKKKRLAKPSE